MQGKVSRTGRFFYNSLLMVGVTLLMRAIGVGFNAYVAGKPYTPDKREYSPIACAPALPAT